ncbi:Lrp/AsnC ligand binding domain-containing protein [Candidatus Aerophobetes bacterium]|nr:Lrp/AsnC ligand binding domain-containing protein [Candidatus Aerophobetes bacterium]
MAKAYLKIKVEMGRERSLRDALLKFDEIRSAELTTGNQDIIAVIESNSYENILQAVNDRFRTLKGVKSTVTDLVLE